LFGLELVGRFCPVDLHSKAVGAIRNVEGTFGALATLSGLTDLEGVAGLFKRRVHPYNDADRGAASAASAAESRRAPAASATRSISGHAIEVESAWAAFAPGATFASLPTVSAVPTISRGDDAVRNREVTFPHKDRDAVSAALAAVAIFAGTTATPSTTAAGAADEDNATAGAAASTASVAVPLDAAAVLPAAAKVVATSGSHAFPHGIASPAARFTASTGSAAFATQPPGRIGDVPTALPVKAAESASGATFAAQVAAGPAGTARAVGRTVAGVHSRPAIASGRSRRACRSVFSRSPGSRPDAKAIDCHRVRVGNYRDRIAGR
jgi:hypothetical protein